MNITKYFLIVSSHYQTQTRPPPRPGDLPSSPRYISLMLCVSIRTEVNPPAFFSQAQLVVAAVSPLAMVVPHEQLDVLTKCLVDITEVRAIKLKFLEQKVSENCGLHNAL